MIPLVSFTLKIEADCLAVVFQRLYRKDDLTRNHQVAVGGLLEYLTRIYPEKADVLKNYQNEIFKTPRPDKDMMKQLGKDVNEMLHNIVSLFCYYFSVVVVVVVVVVVIVVIVVCFVVRKGSKGT